MEHNYSFPGAEIEKVRVKLTWAQIEITSVAADVFNVNIAGYQDSMDELHVELKDDELVIQQPQYTAAQNILPKRRWLQICLFVPESWKDAEMDISTVSGTASLRKLRGKEMSFSTISGRMNVNEIKGKEISLRTVSGGISGTNIASKHLHLRTVSGNITLADLSFDSAKTFSISGNTTLSIDGDDCESLELQSISGDIVIEVEKPIKGASLHSFNGQYSIEEGLENSGEHFIIQASSVSGSLSIHKKKDS